jgi:hypothetical protein
MILYMKSPFFALLAIASFAADSFGQTIINSLPYNITAPGTYVLGANLNYQSAAGAAITIVSSNVTLDLGGHYLYYPGTPTSNVGVYVHNAGNVIIQNGIIAVSNTESISTVLEGRKERRSTRAILCKT